MTTLRASKTPPLPSGVQSFTPLLARSLNGFAVVDSGGRYAFVSDSLCLLLELDKHVLLGCGCGILQCLLSRTPSVRIRSPRGRALLALRRSVRLLLGAPR